MLAYYRHAPGHDCPVDDRLAASLGMAQGRKALCFRDDTGLYAWLPFDRARAAQGTWRPAQAPSGLRVLFNGWIDNGPELAADLAVRTTDPAQLYGLAVERWGDAAERRIVGQYCAIAVPADGPAIRLSRSPLRAPPLHYFSSPAGLGAASVPRALHLMGLEPRLNLRKLADNLYFNLTEDEGFYENSYRVGLGEIVWLSAQHRKGVRWYDPLNLTPQPKARVEDYVREADRLLTAACAASIAGARRPAIQLSGGLDSTNVAARVLRSLPEPRRLDSFTFVPAADWPDTETDRFYTNERSRVEAFAAMHPRLDPAFVDNAGASFDEKLEQMYLVTGTGQASLPIGYAYHGIYARARDLGCDLMLSSDLGNATFSQSGSWGFGEYLRHGKWLALGRAIRTLSAPDRPFIRRLVSLAVVPSLPMPAWKLWQAVRGNPAQPSNIALAHLRPEVLREYDTVARARAAGVSFEREFTGYRQEVLAGQFGRGDIESSDVLQGLEQLYGIRTRDVPAWRPFVEFCLGLPTEVFMRDGQFRWLARELGRGLLPEALRTERRHGFQSADWHARMTPQLPAIRRDLQAARADSDLGRLLDLDRIDALLDRWPAEASFDPDHFSEFAYALPRIVSTIRYVRFIKGTNAG